MPTLSIILLIITGIIQVYDVWSTVTTLRRGGTETNKRVLWLMNRFGVVPALVLTKGGIVCAFSALVWFAGELWFIPAIMAVVNLAYVKMFWNANFKHDGI